MTYFRVNDQCNGCLSCVENCPANALDYKDEKEKRSIFHNMTRCARCGTCWRVCPQAAIEFQYLLENDWASVVSLNLMRCRVCSEPVYTTAFREFLEEKVGEIPETLCDTHRRLETSMARAFPLRRAMAKKGNRK